MTTLSVTPGRGKTVPVGMKAFFHCDKNALMNSTLDPEDDGFEVKTKTLPHHRSMAITIRP